MVQISFVHRILKQLSLLSGATTMSAVHNDTCKCDDYVEILLPRPMYVAKAVKYKCTESQLASRHYEVQWNTWQEAWTVSSVRFSTQRYIQLALNTPRIKAIYLLVVEIGLLAHIANKTQRQRMRSNTKHVETIGRTSPLTLLHDWFFSHAAAKCKKKQENVMWKWLGTSISNFYIAYIWRALY